MTNPTGDPTQPAPVRDPADQLHDRMQSFGREAQAAGQRFGRDPNVIAAGTWIARAWGVVLIAIGLWFFAVVTLGFDLPSLDWNLIWPLGLILLGAFIVTSGLGRRR